ncbi:MAG TPA: serine/threonine-protein kinase, partial [Pyrinomonadaceae bacterium]|nr:serine/threonine-protein kinase [Pyrinomonadaceae bacterium]
MAVTIAPERMTSERFQRIEHLVLSALELAPDERGRMLSTECHGDDELRREVESLLGFQHEAEDFISKPAIAAVAATLAAGELFESVEGQRLGPYRLIKELGHGGMGAVYLAERADEYQKLVAIKVVKRGLATHDLVTRLRSERQILATLDHPNIAKLLDGGALEDGSPYIVMDYVEGLPIDSYCDQHQLSVGQRLQLFRKVCAAVAYAHRNLVIHRDLKPNNIIVATDGTPRLLDFGIAKVLDPSLQTTDDQTATIARIMTPQYASPEQIRGFAVTTSSDIYSLGVLLYKLLSGHLPYQLKSLPPIEIERAVCEKEPERPSTAAARTREATGASTPQFEISNPKLLRGDLDNIVLMAMRKEPERRYESVDAFARDLQRYSAGLPVAARRNTLSYRGSKFIKRHRFGVAATALVVLTMIGGTAASIWQARAAEREKERAKKVSAFLEDTLKYSDPFISPLKKAGKEITVNEVLDEAGRRLDSGEFDSDPELKAELLRAIVQTYFGQGQY